LETLDLGGFVMQPIVASFWTGRWLRNATDRGFLLDRPMAS
jgi:hypothetical protein